MTTLAEQVAELEASVATIARVTEDAVNAGWQIRVAELEREVGGLRADRAILEASVVTLEREREQYHAWWVGAENQLRKQLDRADAAEASLASAKVEGARDALTECAEWIGANSCGVPFSVRGGDDTFPALHVRAFRDREYPAPASPVGEPPKVTCTSCGHDASLHNENGACWHFEMGKVCQCRPAPHAQGTPERVLLTTTRLGCEVIITPADAKRIVGMAQGGTE